MITIPAEQLSADALQGLIEEFVLREGTEYGASEIDLATKRAQVQRALLRGEAVITFDQELETTSIVLTAELDGGAKSALPRRGEDGAASSRTELTTDNEDH